MSINAQVSDAARRVYEKLQAFVASGEYHVGEGRVVSSDETTGGKAMAYDFSQVFSVEGTNDVTILFPHLKELEQTLRSEAVHAKEVMIHNAQEGAPLATGILWLFGNPNGVASGRYVFGARQNIRLVSFDEPDGHRYAVLMVWEQQIKKEQVNVQKRISCFLSYGNDSGRFGGLRSGVRERRAGAAPVERAHRPAARLQGAR